MYTQYSKVVMGTCCHSTSQGSGAALALGWERVVSDLTFDLSVSPVLSLWVLPNSGKLEWHSCVSVSVAHVCESSGFSTLNIAPLHWAIESPRLH